MKVFYLAHSFTCMKKIRRWQLMLESRYNIKFVNPFYNNPYESVEELLGLKSNKSVKDYLQNMDIKLCHGIVDNDLELIRKSDGIVSYFEAPTIGTCQEIIMASYVYRIPVYIITSHYMYHPWIRALAVKSGGKIFKNRTEFKKFVKEKFKERI